MIRQFNLSSNDELTIKILEDLHENWTPHAGQIKAGRALINGEADVIFCQNGRKWGKTDFACYVLWRFALLNPNSSCYYVAPEYSHARELIWNNNRLQRFGPRDYVSKIVQNEGRIRFKNGSQIKILGSENYAAANGLTPDFVVYDEFKAFHPRWHNEFNPNRAAKNAPLVVIGTPPRAGDRNRKEYEELALSCKAEKNSRWMRATSFENPHVDPAWLRYEKDKLFRRGDQDVWYREYEARIVAGGRNSIYPMFNREHYVRPHMKIMEEIKRDRHKLEWYLICDPATTTVFATMFAAVNPYTKKVYILDELYEDDQFETSVGKMYPKMEVKCQLLHPLGDMHEDWIKCYDEAAAWFASEVNAQYSVSFFPTQKHLNKKEQGISLCKDQLVYDLLVISDRCDKFIWEIENYIRDEEGRIPKLNDHLLDCWRYLNAVSNYSMVEALEVIRKKSAHRYKTMDDDRRELRREGDWLAKINEDWLD